MVRIITFRVFPIGMIVGSFLALIINLKLPAIKIGSIGASAVIIAYLVGTLPNG